MYQSRNLIEKMTFELSKQHFKVNFIPSSITGYYSQYLNYLNNYKLKELTTELGTNMAQCKLKNLR